MAVLVEGISVIIKADRINELYPGGWDNFKINVPNSTLCSDNELIRVGFMAPEDVKTYVAKLSIHGLIYQEKGTAKDMIVVDQNGGPSMSCDWVEFGHINLEGDSNKRVAACRLKGSTQQQIFSPDEWKFENSLSASYGFIPNGEEGKNLTFLRTENNLDVYLNKQTGKEVYIGRMGGTE